MAEKHNRDDDGRQPDVWKKGNGAVLEFGRNVRAERGKRKNCRNDDIEKQSERENVPKNQKRTIDLATAKGEKINYRRGDA